MKTPITYYGGKQRMLPEILPLIPKHHCYCEPFFGGGAVFFAKPKAKVEVINDTDDRVINFYRVCQTDFPALKKEIECLLFSRIINREAYKTMNDKSADPVKRAAAFWTAANFGFSGNMCQGFRISVKHNEAAHIKMKRDIFTKDICERLETTVIESVDALRLIRGYDSPETFLYIDPPYFNADCGHYKGYTEADFENLLEALKGIKGKFLLSSYPSPALEAYRAANGWRYREFKGTVIMRGKAKAKAKTECLTCNYMPRQGEMFG